MMTTILGGGVGAILGTNILIKSANTAIEGVLNILSFLKNGNDTHDDIKRTKTEIEKLDIDMKLELMRYMTRREHSEEMEILTRGVDVHISNIERVLNSIKESIDVHNSLWFSSYRVFDVCGQLEELKKLVHIIEERLNYIRKK